MEKLAGLFFDRFNHLPMRMASAGNCDPRHEVQKEIAVNIFNDHATSFFDDERIDPAVCGRRVSFVFLDDGPGFRPRQFRFYVWYFHGSPFRVSSLKFRVLDSEDSKLETRNSKLETICLLGIVNLRLL